MNDKKESFLLLLIAGAAFWAALVFIRAKNSTEKGVSENAAVNEAASQDRPISKGAGPVPTLTPSSAVNDSSNGVTANMASFLREIGACLQIKNSWNENAKPSLSELQTSLQSTFGELTATTSDWKNVHLTLPNGERRRLHIEVIADGEEGVRKELQYYGVDGEDLPVPMSLPPEQAANPTDAFVAGLLSEGQVTLEEEAHHGSYAAEAEIYYAERDGFLSEFEINFQGKRVRCENINKPLGACRCF
jgi:hypothetical protein